MSGTRRANQGGSSRGPAESDASRGHEIDASPWRPLPRPRWLERLNAHAAAAGGAAELVTLDPEELLARACAATGLADFGDGDWRRHYDVLLAALERESGLHLAGRVVVRAELLRSLRNRLQLAELWQRRPELLAAPVDPPVFILGSPRTGSSILHELLALDPANRTPAMWEMLHPVEALAGGALRTVADYTVQFWHDLAPEYESMHANSGELPNECIYITMLEFLSEQWLGCHRVPSYAAHLVRADHRGAFRYHRRFLQTLQARARGERWVLKAPSHIFHLAEIFDVYPEARIVHLHRDPLRTLPSQLSLMATLRLMRCDGVDPVAESQVIAKGNAAVFRSVIERRASGALPDARFVDLRFADVMADTLGAVEALYAKLGWKLGSEARAAMADYIARKPRHARGIHRYTLEEFGLDPAAERERFRFYCERYEVPEEG
jgi:hypothetical protein